MNNFSNPFGLTKHEKKKRFLASLNALTQHHYDHCEAYKHILDSYQVQCPFSSVTDIPPLSVRLFKEHQLSSVPESDIYKILMSSGTSNQLVSKIFLDRDTAKVQTLTLSTIIQDFIGLSRLPMLILDTKTVISDPSQFSARGAGIIGFSIFGTDHTYVLDENMEINEDELNTFLDQHKDQSVLLFGFTFIIFKHILAILEEKGVQWSLSSGYLIHGGGWKKLESESVSEKAFKARIYDSIGRVQVINYYGMVEQVGSIFMACEHGVFHTPHFAEIVIRDPYTLAPMAHGKEGIIEVCSTLPKSYPGHVLLTEDLGVVLGEDDCPCGRKGRYFQVHGRLQKAEVRGCSDTYE